jgi:hypothetical protein
MRRAMQWDKRWWAQTTLLYALALLWGYMLDALRLAGGLVGR